MSSGPWPKNFVGSHVLLTEGDKDPWDKVRESWSQIRFDAIDVLFISPFYVKASDFSFELGNGINLVERFEWVIRAARSKNPNIVIIVVQFWQPVNGENDFELLNDDEKIKMYVDSVAAFIGSYYNKTLPNISGNGQVSARIQGYDVDVESSTLVDNLPKILRAVRQSLDGLAQKLGASKLSVSITPAWAEFLDSTVAQSCDYINMQNYSGGDNTFPEDYLDAVPGLEKQQLTWGFCSETPGASTQSLKQFPGVIDKAQAIAAGEYGGTYTWRVNSDNYDYENIFQVWLYDVVHGTTLPGSNDQSLVQKYWPTGGRYANGDVIPPQDLN
ncbi:hypothetical protein FACUT_14201 [Fusarium acutatum]|uniref:Uncharacterized protein n=1 Tax=Fusarium acutatum TaxID=78861 RepID=A0A8H4J9Y7_9HYPO|nr:hypothetical protein FACUT_14201 [Fusarium acutatum]